MSTKNIILQSNSVNQEKIIEVLNNFAKYLEATYGRTNVLIRFEKSIDELKKSGMLR